MGAALKYRHADIPRQATERARLKVMHGPDHGAVYVISGARAVIGRGEDCDVVISDLKASRKHAELVFADQQWSVRDLGSANGIIQNGRTTRATTVRTGDTLTVGETTLEFLSSEAGTSMLRALPRELDQIQAESAALEAQRQKVRRLAQFGSGPKAAVGVPAVGEKGNPRLILLAAAAGILAFVFFGTSDQPSILKKKPAEKNLAQFLPDTEQTITKSAESFLKAGFREYRVRNYLRARTQFETVLQIAPGNAIAHLYLENCEKAIEDEVKFHLERGKRSYESGSLKQSKIHYESVMRLLFRDQSNPAFVEAKEQRAVVTKELSEE